MNATSRSLLSGAAFRLLVLVTTLQACVLMPEWQQLATAGGLESRWVETDYFRHRVLLNDVQGKHLRIYIEGDGSPWLHGTRVAVDPTPSNPLLLRLMHKVEHAAVYLGRPCYFGTATSKNCSARQWTVDRYDRQVTQSMCSVANQLARELNASSVQLIGYSGGGAIAIQMRACTDRLHSIVTIAGNLDPNAWTVLHGYAALNVVSVPTTLAAKDELISESHWQCRADRNIPPSATDNYFQAHVHAIRHIVDSCTHASGWDAHWTQIVGLH